MNILPINGANLSQKNTNFKSRLLVDIGGSVGENSLKMLLIDNKSNDTIHKIKGIVNHQGKRVYQNQTDFLQKLSNKIAGFYKEAIEKNAKDDTIKEAGFFLPGTVHNNKLLYADNIRGLAGLGMSDIDLNQITNMLKEKGVKLAKDFKISTFQDSMGSGLAVAKKLHDNGMLHAGDHYSVIITGGGCGVSNIRAIADDKAIVDATGSSYFTNEQGLVKIANAGASASKLINNFCNAFGIEKQIGPQIASCGIGQVATSEIFMIPKNAQGKKLKNLLLSLKKYAPEDSTDPHSKLVLKPMYTLYDKNSIRVTDDFSKDFKHARLSAIDKYASSLAKFAVIKENEGANGLIITGPLGFALDSALRKHHASSLSEMIARKIYESYNTQELDQIKNHNKFRVICNPEFNLPDNTEARNLALQSELVGENRYNWLLMKF